MRRVSRLVGLLLSLMLFQLQLVESGYVCRAGASAAMAGMAMRTDAAPSAEPAPTGPAHGEDRTPCRFPWAPDGCRSMAPCGPAALPAVVARPDVPVRIRSTPPTFAATVPAAPILPPELPPPRA